LQQRNFHAASGTAADMKLPGNSDKPSKPDNLSNESKLHFVNRCTAGARQQGHAARILKIVKCSKAYLKIF
jgi:hypothetical protein